MYDHWKTTEPVRFEAYDDRDDCLGCGAMPHETCTCHTTPIDWEARAREAKVFRIVKSIVDECRLDITNAEDIRRVVARLESAPKSSWDDLCRKSGINTPSDETIHGVITWFKQIATLGGK